MNARTENDAPTIDGETHLVGKIELLTEPDDLTIAYMVGFSKGQDKANKNAIERVAKWQCIQHDEDPIAADGYENWKNFIPLAREILGVG